MRWRGRRGSSNVEDRRGVPVRGAVGGGVGLLVVVVLALVFGVDPTMLLEGGGGGAGGPGASQPAGETGVPDDEGGPYVELDFFRQLRDRFGAPGDFAQAYVIAHEVGHHVQNVTGTMERFPGSGASGPGSDAVRMELQADCYAGVWAHDQRERGFLEPGDIEEALNAAAAIGDDTLQRRGQGTVVPESFTHGTSEQRARWFRTGYEAGDPARCDTFAARSL